MSLRTEPRGLSEKVAALEEWARKIDLANVAAAVAIAIPVGETECPCILPVRYCGSGSDLELGS